MKSKGHPRNPIWKKLRRVGDSEILTSGGLSRFNVSGRSRLSNGIVVSTKKTDKGVLATVVKYVNEIPVFEIADKSLNYYTDLNLVHSDSNLLMSALGIEIVLYVSSVRNGYSSQDTDVLTVIMLVLSVLEFHKMSPHRHWGHYKALNDSYSNEVVPVMTALMVANSAIFNDDKRDNLVQLEKDLTGVLFYALKICDNRGVNALESICDRFESRESTNDAV